MFFSVLNSYFLLLLRIVCLIDGFVVGKYLIVIWFLKGVYNLNLIKLKYCIVWDVLIFWNILS